MYDRLHSTDSAYFYFKKYIAIKESVVSGQTKGKYAAYKYEEEINSMNNEKLIARQRLKIQQQQLSQASFQKKILVIGIFVLILIAGIFFRVIMLKRNNERHQREIVENELQLQKIASEKDKAELQQQATKLEMQALRSQMNPHFVFNSLNAINMFILENNKLQASEYLSKFSKLIRLILQNSQEAFIPLERELEALQLYLELESLRFEQRFEYKITIDDTVDTTMFKVPPLIIQPYAENAIWHGLMHKEEKGHLAIELYIEKKTLFYKIADDGIGRKKAAELKSKSAATHKSMGMRITKDRLLMLQQQNEKENSILITDLVLADGASGGTAVLIKIPVRYD